MSRFVVRPCPPAAYRALTAGGVPPLLARIYGARGVERPEALDLSLSRLASGEDGARGMAGLGRAASLLADAVASGAKVAIFGDYDCDGATSTVLLMDALGAFGARNPVFCLPNRFIHGYGLTPQALDLVPPDVELLVTVDNGISSVDGVRAARARGLKVIVTDHHLPGPELSAADAIVNPNQPGCPFPWKGSAGVGVAFYLAAATRARLREMGYFSPSRPAPNLAPLLDLVALGTVADVVPLEHNNRVFVAEGLRRMNGGRARPGIQALLEIAGRTPPLTAADLAFGLAPRINAAGRLADMDLGIRLLLAESLAEARPLAERLDSLNRERRAIEADMGTAAELRLELDEDLAARYGICLFEEDWHEGVVGIVAGRIRERLHRPVLAFARAQDGLLKGSGRSIPGLHLRDALALLAARHPGMVHRFGGHAMAAGLTLAEGDLCRFRTAFEAVLQELLGPEALEERIETDGTLAAGDFTAETARLLEQAGPWGSRFPEPLFLGEFRLRDLRELRGGHLRLSLEGPDGVFPEAVQFRPRLIPEAGCRLRVAYALELDRFRDGERLRLRVQDWENL